MSVRTAIGRDLRTTVVAVIAASVVAGPSAAAVAYVVNADKVDNKHAVGAGSAVSTREGKLVATSSRTGLLPNNIIAKAPNSESLDGLDSRDFLRANGTAADADKLDGRELGDLLPMQVSAEFGNPEGGPIAPLSNRPDDIAQISMTVPGPGRVQVDGQTVLFGSFPSTSYAHADLSISSTPDTHNPSDAGIAIWAVPAEGTSESTTAVHYETIPTTRTFEVTEAGTYTYYVVAKGGTSAAYPGDTLYHYSSQVQAQYFPTP